MAPMFDQHRVHFDMLRDAALRAVDPAAAVGRSVSPADYADAKHIFVVGAGKAGIAMTEALFNVLGDRLTAGVVSVPVLPSYTSEKKGTGTLHGTEFSQFTRLGSEPVPFFSQHQRITFIAGGHPIPDKGSVAAGRAMAKLLTQTTAQDLVIALISGGGSALVELPRSGLNLADLQTTTNALLKCGATIHEINCIRTRLSRIKGGGLARLACPARLLGLILSDVVGNSLEIIASGPTVPVNYSTTDAKAVIDKYHLQTILPGKVLKCLAQQPDEMSIQPSLSAVENRLIASGRLAGEAAVAAAKKMGYKSYFLADDWQGEARDVGDRFGHWLTSKTGKGPKCYVVGGETTVTVYGGGKGGRNQELALAAACAIDGRSNIAIAAFATDGIDGPTDAAGAIVTGDTIKHGRLLGLDPQQHLDDNNAYPFFSALGDLIITGPTGTNVSDLLFGLVY